ncbi:hypothetical protein CEUSTIGMA_g11063.t1 [Chlamydomonas eustigma]|uniref:Ubiquitin-like domain-containing protein n=1 Tax=Chlamydomonas eustigma TaxID=1157962 RepID=A0A250XL42_9CHLO|nr:hypothetical protein CEUSTIGMA_g11063.t1 [Chlamydomonas eustigma]|eukprot:GAX83639.1 hypothetical protein CEUSTIGMA_g11063.t1 [Chlamydomonas eustigma]
MVKKGIKKGGRYVSTLPPFEFQPPSVYDLGYQPPEYVTCRICHKSLTTSPLNFEWAAVPTDAVTLAMVKDAIFKRHGGATTSLLLYKDQAKEECSLAAADDGATLKDLGVKGSTTGSVEDLPKIVLYYDYDSGFPSYDNVIVLVDFEPLRPKHGVPSHARPSSAAAAAAGSAGKQLHSGGHMRPLG